MRATSVSYLPILKREERMKKAKVRKRMKTGGRDCLGGSGLATYPAYSLRRATSGSTRMARRAGTQDAASTTHASSAAANPYVRLSVRETP